MSSRPNGFDPNQKRDGRGRFAEEHGTRPASGGLQRRPAEEWPDDAWPEPDAREVAPNVPETPQRLPKWWGRNSGSLTGAMYYGYRDKRDHALNPASWGGGRRPVESFSEAGDAAQGMLETAPLRIQELVSERYPNATTVTFRSVNGDLQVTGYTTDLDASSPEIRKLVDDDKAMAEEINTINKDLLVTGAKTSSHDLAGLRVDASGTWHLPLTGQETDGPGFARSSPEGVRIECDELERDGLQLERASAGMPRPTAPIEAITSQRELMWFAKNGTEKEIEQVADSDHARAAVLHTIAHHGPQKAAASAVMSWQVSEATIRSVHAKTPKTEKAMRNAGLQNAAKAPNEIREEARRPATYAKQKAAEQKRVERAEREAARPTPAPRAQSPRVAPAPDPRHWKRMYTPEQRAYLREHMPIGFDEYGSSQADMWEDAQLEAFERQKRAHRG